ncbi:MAG: TRAP transporter substrate-binding protein [Deltaproteobacteria bacterium]|nr:TRAP transporter substrate-binding protein [Deltaproteobacteria bacterium]
MRMRKISVSLVMCLVAVFFVFGMAWAQGPSLDAWKPAFDPSTAKYKAIVSNVSHPVLKGTYAGFAIRDELWKRTNGQIYVDFKPFSMLGGEVEVLNQLQMGAIQGMLVSSVAATNLGPRIGLVNLPFLINSFEKLDKFVTKGGKLFDHFLMAMDHQGITGLDINSYGNYGWATTVPVQNIADAKKVKFRIAEAAVNKLSYKSWGLNAVVMPWPDVPVALKQGVITGLDHTLTVCNVTKKFEVAKYYTRLDYAMGLFVNIFNTKWLNSLPADLRETFIQTVKDVNIIQRHADIGHEQENIKQAEEKYGVTFYKLSDADIDAMRNLSNEVHDTYKAEINRLYPGDKYRPADYLAEVYEFMGYKR